MEKKCKIILNPVVARQLLKLGHSIVDIKPNKDEARTTIFVFEDGERFRKDLTQITNQYKK